MSRCLLVLCLFSLFAGCSSSGNVDLSSAIQEAREWPSEGERVIRLYYDRDGDLYPATFLEAPLPPDALKTRAADFTRERHYQPGNHSGDAVAA